jgi:hypothetical protein
MTDPWAEVKKEDIPDEVAVPCVHSLGGLVWRKKGWGSQGIASIVQLLPPHLSPVHTEI